MDRIFSWINRINSVLFLLVLIGVSIGATLTYLAYQEMFDRYHRETASVASQSEPAEQPLRLSLGEVDRINGSNTLMVFLFGEEPWGSKGRNEEIRNVLFLSGDGAHARWLFETHTNLLQEIDELRRQDASTEALYYEIVRTDSDGDGELTITICSPWRFQRATGLDSPRS